MNLRKILPVILGASILLSACGLTQQPVAPTTDPNAVAATVAAAQTQAVGTALAGVPTSEVVEAPTYTPYPTYTPFPSPTAETPVTLATPTAQAPVVLPTTAVLPTTQPQPTQAAAPTFTAAPKALSCTITFVSPNIGTSVDPGYDFDGKFTVKNTGTQDWGSGDFDIVYASGESSMAKVQRYNMPKSVAVGESMDVTLDLVAPTTAGRYTVTYMLGGTFCPMSITVTVK